VIISAKYIRILEKVIAYLKLESWWFPGKTGKRWRSCPDHC